MPVAPRGWLFFGLRPGRRAHPIQGHNPVPPMGLGSGMAPRLDADSGEWSPGRSSVRAGTPAPILPSCGGWANTLTTGRAVLVSTPRVPVHTGTHGKTPAMADRILLTVQEDASQLTVRYSPHLCTAGSGTARRATRVPQQGVSNGHLRSPVTTAGRRSRPGPEQPYRVPKLIIK